MGHFTQVSHFCNLIKWSFAIFPRILMFAILGAPSSTSLPPPPTYNTPWPNCPADSSEHMLLLLWWTWCDKGRHDKSLELSLYCYDSYGANKGWQTACNGWSSPYQSFSSLFFCTQSCTFWGTWYILEYAYKLLLASVICWYILYVIKFNNESNRIITLS